MNQNRDARDKALRTWGMSVTVGLWTAVMIGVALVTRSGRSMMTASLLYGVAAIVIGFAVLIVYGGRAALLGRADARNARAATRPEQD